MFFSSNQYAYRKFHSCTRALIKTMDNIYKNIDENQIVILVFLDFKQAFPSIDHNILIEKLKILGLNNNDIFLMYNYLKNTKHITKIKDVKSNEDQESI